jgi:ankyrin repeat protein
LCVSVKNGYLDIVKYLIENGADIHVISNKILQLATQNGHLNVVEYVEQLRV